MNPDTKTQPIEDPDVNNRLRYGLNIDCLARIFQYLNSRDLWILGGMNEHFKELINDLVIPTYKLNVFESDNPELFARHGKSIRKFFIVKSYDECIDTLEQINHHCAVDQLNHTEFEIDENMMQAKL